MTKSQQNRKDPCGLDIELLVTLGGVGAVLKLGMYCATDWGKNGEKQYERWVKKCRVETKGKFREGKILLGSLTSTVNHSFRSQGQ